MEIIQHNKRGFSQSVKRGSWGRFAPQPFRFNATDISNLALGVLFLICVALIGYIVGIKVCQSHTVVDQNGVSMEFINTALQNGWLKEVK